jgi:hypothetical protein
MSLNAGGLGGWGGGGVAAGSKPMSTAVHRSPNKFGDLAPYLTYGSASLVIIMTYLEPRFC